MKYILSGATGVERQKMSVIPDISLRSRQSINYRSGDEDYTTQKRIGMFPTVCRDGRGRISTSLDPVRGIRGINPVVVINEVSIEKSHHSDYITST